MFTVKNVFVPLYVATTIEADTTSPPVALVWYTIISLLKRTELFTATRFTFAFVPMIFAVAVRFTYATAFATMELPAL